MSKLWLRLKPYSLYRLVEKLRPFLGMQHLDVAGGTGDAAFRVLEAMRMAEFRRQPAAAAEQPA